MLNILDQQEHNIIASIKTRMSKNKKVNIIGAGLAGLSASCFLAQAGFEVSVFEKNSKPGGRANFFEVDGFKFDMGPSWYWLPDVFENFFKSFNRNINEFYDLKKLETPIEFSGGKRLHRYTSRLNNFLNL